MKSFLVGFALAMSSGVAFGQTSTMPIADQQALVTKYCSGCHNDRLKSGGFSWTTIDLANPAQNLHEAEKVIRNLRAGMMPPSGRPRPERTALNSSPPAVDSALDRTAAAPPLAAAP